jgi:hypothetical protein
MKLILFLILYIFTFFFYYNYYKKNNSIKYVNYNYKENYKIYEDPVDAVITWVNSSDPNWKELKNKYSKEYNLNVIDNSSARFPLEKYNDLELFLCVSCINKFLPWINNIYIVVHENQKPSWLNNFNNITMINHSQIFPNKNYLPTFNSHAIESCLHYIPGLSEKFNDDVYIIDFLDKIFFYLDNKPITSGQLKNIKNHNLFVNSPYANSWINLSNLLDKEYLLLPTHCCTPLTKTLLKTIEENYYDIFDNTRKSRFRSNYDIPPWILY